jgi:hypothetical protein
MQTTGHTRLGRRGLPSLIRECIDNLRRLLSTPSTGIERTQCSTRVATTETAIAALWRTNSKGVESWGEECGWPRNLFLLRRSGDIEFAALLYVEIGIQQFEYSGRRQFCLNVPKKLFLELLLQNVQSGSYRI